MVCIVRLGLGSFIQALSLLGSWFVLAVGKGYRVGVEWGKVRDSCRGTWDSGMARKTVGNGGLGFGGYDVDEVLDEGSSRSMVVDEGEPAISIALGATATGTGETTLCGGLKYSSNMGWNKRSQSFLFDGLKGCDLQVLVEHFNPVEGNTGVLESDVLDDSTYLILLEDVRGL
ncbi:hypothetical protein Tco_0438775 [Tanacetum coccineum]